MDVLTTPAYDDKLVFTQELSLDGMRQNGELIVSLGWVKSRRASAPKREKEPETYPCLHGCRVKKGYTKVINEKKEVELVE